MNKHTLLSLMLIFYASLLSAQASKGKDSVYFDKAFVHPGMMQSKQDLDFMKAKVLAGAAPWKKAFENLKISTSLAFIPHPVTYISQGAYGAEDHGGRSLTQSANQVYNDAIMWYITGDRRYAKKAIEILNAWSDKLWGFDGNNAKLLAGLSGYYFLNAAEILRYSPSGWEEKDISQFRRLMLTVYYPLIKNFFTEANGNWDASMINTMLCIGIFTDNPRIFNRAVKRFYIGPGNSGVTKYIWPNGQTEEATRDWGHVQLGLGEFAKAAQVAWTQGIDFYSAADNRLALGFEYAAKFMLGEDVPAYGSISQRERGQYKDRDIYEGIYDHYHIVTGLKMPYTLRVIKEHTRASSTIGVLTALRAPATASTEKSLTGLPLNKDNQLKGALAVATAEVPEHAVRIKPGQSIQKAIDALKGEKGWIVLTSGVHILDAPLRIPSNLTLAGSGRTSILWLNPKMRGFTLVSADSNLHNVLLRDFLIEGASSTLTAPDPNDERRKRSYMNAPDRGGIRLSAMHTGQISNIKFYHLTVQNCTENGISLSGAKNIIIDSCNFSDNGANVVPGAGLHHNLYLAHIMNGDITNNRLDGSPWGSGIHLEFGTDINICGNELARNQLSGLWCSEIKDVKVTNNLMEGNNCKGIFISTLVDKPVDVLVKENTVRNNGQH